MPERGTLYLPGDPAMPLPRLLPPKLGRQIGRFGPAMGRRRWPDILRAAVGAGLGILIVTLIVAAQPRSLEAQVYLVSSFASTAVLLFVLPNSPLAQPWSALVGMMVSAAVPVAVLAWVPPPWADGLAVAGAIIAMMALRALHPPAAGLALLAVLEFEGDHPLGLGFAIFPVGVITLVLVVFAIVWNNLFGSPYPARPASRGRDTGRAGGRRGLTQGDLESLLLEFNQSANIAPADLARLLDAAEARAADALLAGTPVSEVMTRAPITLAPESPMTEILRKRAPLGLHAMPVCDSEGLYLGVLDQDRLMLRLVADIERLRRPFRRLAPPAEAEARTLMDTGAAPVAPDLPLRAVLERLSHSETRIVPVTERGRLVGVIARSDIVTFLLSRSLAPTEDKAARVTKAEDEPPSPAPREAETRASEPPETASEASKQSKTAPSEPENNG